MKPIIKYTIYGICTLILLSAILLHTNTVDHSARAQEVNNYLLERHLDHLFD